MGRRESFCLIPGPQAATSVTYKEVSLDGPVLTSVPAKDGLLCKAVVRHSQRGETQGRAGGTAGPDDQAQNPELSACQGPTHTSQSRQRSLSSAPASPQTGPSACFCPLSSPP